MDRLVAGVVRRCCGVLAFAMLSACATLPAPVGPPPRPFVDDGCTLFPDGDYAACCAVHDRVYWCGGTREERRLADRRLAGCVASRGHTALARLMRLGVRVGGAPWWPTPWRWGFGWPYPLGYTDAPIAACADPPGEVAAGER